ncbi:MAG: ATP-binding protein [Rhodospirillales bacterium]
MTVQSQFRATGAAGSSDSASLAQRIGLRRAIVAFTLAGVVAVDGMIGLSVMRQRDQALADATRQIDNLSRVLVEHTSQAITAIDQALLGASDAITGEMLREPPGNPAVSTIRRRHLASRPHVNLLLTADAEGLIREAAVSTPGFDPLGSVAPGCGYISPHAGHLKHPDADAATMHIQAVNPRDGCVARIAISRRIEDSGAMLPEIVAAVIRPSYFQAFYQTLATGREGATGLWDTTGLLIAATGPLAARIGARFTPHSALVGQGPEVRNGVQHIVSRIDRRELLIAYRAVHGQPLFVSIGVGIDEVLAAWRQQALTAAGGGIAVTLAIALMAVMLMRIAAHGSAASAALRESERRFRDLAEVSSDWFWEQDENFRCTYLSTQAGYHSGLPTNAHYGKTHREVGVLGPTEREWNEHEAVLRTRQPFKDFRLHRVLPDGATRHFSVSGVPVFDETGRFKGYRGTGHDITAEVAAREELQEIIDAIPAMINAKDLESRYVLMNAYQARLYGTTPKDAAGKTAAELLGQSYGNYTRGRDQEVIDTGRPSGFYEERYPGVDGEMRDWMTNKLPLFDGAGRANRVITVAMDITAQKAVERRLIDARGHLQEAKEAAEAANRAKTNFLANMSHELRTPLNAILGFSEMMAHEMLGPIGTPKYLEFAEGVHRSGAMLLQHINDVLDMAKIEAGRRELHPEWFGFAEAANDAILVIRQRAEESGVSLRFDVPHTLPPIHADRRAVGQVLVNLLTNAVKFTPRGGAVTLGAELSGGRFVVTVTDTGVGIEPDELERLGTPFYQVQPSMTRSHEGTGLGLALTKSLVVMHGGECKIASTPGKGTTVTVVFPGSDLQLDVA